MEDVFKENSEYFFSEIVVNQNQTKKSRGSILKFIKNIIRAGL